MAKRLLSSVEADFANVVSYYKPHPALNDDNSLATLHAIHASCYSLILWKFRLGGMPAHARPFIEEIASDALQIIPHVLSGFDKTARLLIRGIIENCLRHIYFSDHPIEFAWMNGDKKWFLSNDELTTYVRRHPEFKTCLAKFNALENLASLHSELSSRIHGTKVSDLELRSSIAKIGFSLDAAGQIAEDIRRCAGSANFLLARLYRAKVQSLQAEDRKIIVNEIPRSARLIWKTDN